MSEQMQPNSKFSFLKGIGVGVVIVLILGGVYFTGQRSNGASSVKKSSAALAQAPSQPSAPQPSGDIQVVAVSDTDWIRGDRNAPISVVEFSDLECPFCKRFHPTMQQLIGEYDGKVKWVYRHFPLSSLHSKAPKEAEATECAGELGGNDAFWKYVDRVFEVTPSNNGLDPEQLPEIAQYIGLNKDAFQTCLDSGKYAQKVQDQYNQAIASGGRGTPHSIVITPDGQKIPIQGALPYEQVKQIIDALL